MIIVKTDSIIIKNLAIAYGFPDVEIPGWCTGVIGNTDGSIKILGGTVLQQSELRVQMYCSGIRGNDGEYDKEKGEAIIKEAVIKLWKYTPGIDCVF